MNRGAGAVSWEDRPCPKQSWALLKKSWMKSCWCFIAREMRQRQRMPWRRPRYYSQLRVELLHQKLRAPFRHRAS